MNEDDSSFRLLPLDFEDSLSLAPVEGPLEDSVSLEHVANSPQPPIADENQQPGKVVAFSSFVSEHSAQDSHSSNPTPSISQYPLEEEGELICTMEGDAWE